MLLKVSCKYCKKKGFIDTKDMPIDDFKQWLDKQDNKPVKCCFGEHEEDVVMKDMYNIDFDSSVSETKTISEEDFERNLICMYDEIYTESQLQSKFELDSIVDNQYLVHSKSDEDDMRVYHLVKSPVGNKFFIR